MIRWRARPRSKTAAKAPSRRVKVIAPRCQRFHFAGNELSGSPSFQDPKKVGHACSMNHWLRARSGFPFARERQPTILPMKSPRAARWVRNTMVRATIGGQASAEEESGPVNAIRTKERARMMLTEIGAPNFHDLI